MLDPPRPRGRGARARRGVRRRGVPPPALPCPRPAAAHACGGGEPDPGGRAVHRARRPRALRAQVSCGAVYRAVLRAEVRERFGWVSWRQVGRGLFEIEGVPDGVLRHFSQRRAEIEERAFELVGAGASLSREAMQTIALATRRPKQATEAMADWRADAARPRSRARARAGRAQRARGWAPAEPRLPLGGRSSSGCPARGPDRNHNTFARRHALAELAGEFPDGIGLRDLELVADKYLADASVEQLAPDNQGQARYSTVGLLACEARILETAAGSRDAGVAVLKGRRVDAALRDAGLNRRSGDGGSDARAERERRRHRAGARRDRQDDDAARPRRRLPAGGIPGGRRRADGAGRSRAPRRGGNPGRDSARA